MKRVLLSFGFLVFCSGCLEVTQQDQSTGPQYPTVDLPLPVLNTKAGNFANCDELISWQREKAAQWNHYNTAVTPVTHSGLATSVAAGTVAGGAAGGAAWPTNVQERGIDEPDILKADEQSLFIARTQSVEIVNQNDLSLEQSLDMYDLRNIELGLANGQLVVMGASATVLGAPTGVYSYSQSYVIRTFARGIDGKFAQVKSVTLSGTLIGARMKDNLLTIVTQDELNWDENLSPVGEKIRGVTCSAIQRPIVDDFSASLTYIHQVDVTDLNSLQSIARFGRTDSIYMGQKNLYLLGSGYTWFWQDPRNGTSLRYDDLFVSQFSLDGGPRFKSAGKINGVTVDQFAMNENADEKLNIATTERYGNNMNALWTLQRKDSELNVLGVVSGYGSGEQIRSVRYFGDYAYVVTFRQFDPLFVFDVSADDPQLVAELDVPGFSSYLHPLSDGRLVGVGSALDQSQREPSGVQVSYFNLAQPRSPSVIAQVKYGSQFSYADAAADHHAFYLDEASGILALPGRLFKPSGADLEFSGALVLNVNAPSTSYGKITHWDWVPDGCRARQLNNTWWSGAPSMDVRRVMKIGSQLASISMFGVRLSDPANGLVTSKALQFSDNEAECDRMRSI